jgi:hypothetical protein
MYAHKISLVIAIAAGLSISGVVATRTTQALTAPAHCPGLALQQLYKPIIFDQTPGNSDIANQALNSAATEFENIATLAINGKSDAITNEVPSIATAVHEVKRFTPGQTFRDLANRLSEIKAAQIRGDFESLAITAIEGYRTIRLAQDPATLSVPIEVYLLKYAGLKAQALVRTDSPDWERLTAIADETSNYWTAISPKIKEKPLGNLVDTIILGIKRALAEQNVGELRFAIKLQLNAVDLLKGAFLQA